MDSRGISRLEVSCLHASSWGSTDSHVELLDRLECYIASTPLYLCTTSYGIIRRLCPSMHLLELAVIHTHALGAGHAQPCFLEPSCVRTHQLPTYSVRPRVTAATREENTKKSANRAGVKSTRLQIKSRRYCGISLVLQFQKLMFAKPLYTNNL